MTFFLYVIFKYVKDYFCFYAWIKYILNEKYIKTFFFDYNKKIQRCYIYVCLNKWNEVFDYDLFDPSQQDIIVDIFCPN